MPTSRTWTSAGAPTTRATRTSLCPTAKCYHICGASTGAVKYNAFKSQQSGRNSILLPLKNEPLLMLIVNFPAGAGLFCSSATSSTSRGFGDAWDKGCTKPLPSCSGRLGKRPFRLKDLPNYMLMELWMIWNMMPPICGIGWSWCGLIEMISPKRKTPGSGRCKRLGAGVVFFVSAVFAFTRRCSPQPASPEAAVLRSGAVGSGSALCRCCPRTQPGRPPRKKRWSHRRRRGWRPAPRFSAMGAARRRCGGGFGLGLAVRQAGEVPTAVLAAEQVIHILWWACPDKVFRMLSSVLWGGYSPR